jgi:prepilin-type N-terminal cleavage/methylation domain-containing protein
MKQPAAGFTLIEMVIAILVTGIIAAAGAYGIANGALAFRSTSNALDTIGKLRLSTARIAGELRGIQRDPLDSGRYDIVEPLSASQISFVKSDGTEVDIATVASTVTLAYDTPAGTYTQTDQLSSFTISYYENDGVTPAGGADSVAFIEFEIVLTDADGNNHAQITRVGLRGQS